MIDEIASVGKSAAQIRPSLARIRPPEASENGGHVV
jgi:hypothetical protein